MLTWTPTADGTQRAVIAQGADDATPLLTLIVTPSLGSWQALVQLGGAGPVVWVTRVATEDEAKATAARLARETLQRALAVLS